MRPENYLQELNGRIADRESLHTRINLQIGEEQKKLNDICSRRKALEAGAREFAASQSEAHMKAVKESEEKKNTEIQKHKDAVGSFSERVESLITDEALISKQKAEYAVKLKEVGEKSGILDKKVADAEKMEKSLKEMEVEIKKEKKNIDNEKKRCEMVSDTCRKEAGALEAYKKESEVKLKERENLLASEFSLIIEKEKLLKAKEGRVSGEKNRLEAQWKSLESTKKYLHDRCKERQ